MYEQKLSRKCGSCGNYDSNKHKCNFFHKKLPESAYCVVEEKTVFFIT
ncbi:MAG: hypothetical protein GF311_00015 [Candidatus Lokiarchaeota archaeon]|nr:hypothetical protein [Candidatus Lokiarchaeota archaeon]